MNKKLIIKFSETENKSCVLSPDRDFDAQLTELYGFAPGQGYAAELHGDRLVILDVFHQDTVASFKAVSLEDTEDEVRLEWEVC